MSKSMEGGGRTRQRLLQGRWPVGSSANDKNAPCRGGCVELSRKTTHRPEDYNWVSMIE